MPKSKKLDPKKYAKFKNEPNWQMKIDEQKLNLQANNYKDKISLAKILQSARALKEEKEQEVSQLNVEIEAATQMLTELLTEEGINSFETSDGWKFIGKVSVFVSISDEGKAEFYQWLRKHDHGEMFSVNYMTASAMVKERIENGLEIPPGVKIFAKESITVYKPRGE
jgi:hypothetical protein